MSYGRGGAGNISARGTPAGGPALSTTMTDTDTDIEANRGASTQAQHTLPEIDPSDPPRRPGDYAHTGRGGAGNWYQPNALIEEGSYNITTSPHTSSSTKSGSTTQVQKAQWSGRGGAGNFQPAATESREESAEDAAEVSKRAERDVEMGLSRPEQAFLGGREKAVDIGSAVEEPGLSV